jgi:putative ABC transport system permease protein
MWRNYLLVTLRLMARHRIYTAINIGGLALGLAGCLLILNYVRVERSYDRWIPDHERVFAVQARWHEPGQPVTRSQASPFPVRDTLAAGFPQIEAISVFRTGQTVTSRDGQPRFIDVAAVDPSFLDIVALPFAHGSAAGAFAPDTVIVTEREARAAFGRTDVVGRAITLGAEDGRRDRRVTGVLKDLPSTTSLKFGILMRFNRGDYDGSPPDLTGWGSMDQHHFVKLRSAADAAAINAALPAWEKRTIPSELIDGTRRTRADILDLMLVPIADVHLGEAQLAAMTPGGDPRALAAFMLVAALTLGMAMMNYVNLATARAALRAREVGLRKLLGATRAKLIVQMLGESYLTTALAMLFGLSIVELGTPWVAAWTGADLRISYFGEHGMALPALTLFLVTGFAGGLYPAFYLSRFPPTTVLRANRSVADTPGGGWLRTSLVVLQFAIAIGLIVSTWVIYSQVRYGASADPGYRRDGLIQVDQAWRFAGQDSDFRLSSASCSKCLASSTSDVPIWASSRAIMCRRSRSPAGPGACRSASTRSIQGISPHSGRKSLPVARSAIDLPKTAWHVRSRGSRSPRAASSIS